MTERRNIDPERAKVLDVSILLYFANYNLGSINESKGLKPLDIIQRYKEELLETQNQDYPEITTEEALIDMISHSDIDGLAALSLMLAWGELYGAGNRFHIQKRELAL